MKAIITTPSSINFSWVVGHFRKEKVNMNDYPFYRVLHTPGKHLYVEYDENNGNLLQVLYDLDVMGGWPTIDTVEKFEKFFKGYKQYAEELL